MLQFTLCAYIIWSAVCRHYTCVMGLHSWWRQRQPIKHKFHIECRKQYRTHSCIYDSANIHY